MSNEELEERMSALEDRVALLEARTSSRTSDSSGPVQSDSPSSPPVPAPASSVAGRSRTIVGLALAKKRFDPQNIDAGKYEDNIWMDFVLTLAADSRTTRAVKGTMTFCDLFGEPHFLLGYTNTDPLQPGVPHKVEGIGFEFNQFLDAHKWLMAQDVSDLNVYFDVTQIIFQDGSTESFD